MKHARALSKPEGTKAKTAANQSPRPSPYVTAARAPRFLDRAFDARPDRLDLRDLPYRPPLRSLPTSYPANDNLKAWLPKYVAANLILDQGTEGACTGFGLACVVNYLLWIRHYESGGKGAFQAVSPRMLYELARRYDEWPGEDYDGSSCRGALKGWHKHGVCGEALWPYSFDAQGRTAFVAPKLGWESDALARTLGVYYRVDRKSVVDIQAAIINIGAVYVSARVHAGWDKLVVDKPLAPPQRHDQVPDIVIPKRKGQLGGHAFALVGFDERGFIVQNSWGTIWGASGFGRMLYEDWVAHGTDAWVCALGVPAAPSAARVRATRWPVASGHAVNQFERVSRAANNPPDDPWPIDHEFEHKPYEPLGTHEAYLRTLVSGNDGELSVRDLTRGGPQGAADYAREIVLEQPLAWLRKRPQGAVKLALYAHGGLVNEEASIARVRVLAPYFLANDIYPLFLTWRTGVGETIANIVGDWVKKIPGVDEELVQGLGDWIADQKDRAIEAIGRPLGRGVWSEMRENAERAMLASRSLDLLAQNLVPLADQLKATGRPLEVHLIGHSAGSILLGHFLERLMRDPAPPSYTLTSAQLCAAACSVDFANSRYLTAADTGLLALERLRLYYLSDENEKADALPKPSLPAYGKSLLYLVSRALDDVRKQPLLGMARAVEPGFERDSDQWHEDQLAAVRAWQQRWKASPGSDKRAIAISDRSIRQTKTGSQIPATHGSFDNNIDVMTAIIESIRGKKLDAPMEWLDY